MTGISEVEKRPGSYGEVGNVNGRNRQASRRISAFLPLLIVVALVNLTILGSGLDCWPRAAAPVSGQAVHRTGSSSPDPSIQTHDLAKLTAVSQEHGLAVQASDEGMKSLKRDEDASTSAAAARATVLECFQVAQPVLTPNGATTSDGRTAPNTSPPASKSCTVQLMSHVFGNSYDRPFIGNYVPPKCDFNRVTINFTAVSAGRQFDRLAIMYLNDTEVWRTSTAEPTARPGIRWVYLKDMTQYLSLWKQPQKIIFDLGNLINDKYTAPFNTTLTATFFTADVNDGSAPPSDLIIPISARKSASNAVSQFTLPADTATNTISFPRNVKRAVFSVSANGQADEEFWWSNVLQSSIYTFNQTSGAFPGLSPFREVQVLIDGKLAGVQWPFPVIFTGGVVPSLHRPGAGIDVFDLREHEIDITPWLPVLCDGAQHSFTIRVAGLNDDGGSTGTLTQTVGASWYVTGKIFIWLDKEGSITTGTPPTISDGQLSIRVSQVVGKNSTGANNTLDYTAEVSRSFSVAGNIVTQDSSGPATWTQALSFSNKGRITDFGNNQVNDMSLHGTDRSAGLFSYSSDYQYPLFCNTTAQITKQGNMTLWSYLKQGLQLQVSGSAVFPTGLEAFASRKTFAGGSLLDTTTDGTANFYQSGDGKSSSGFGSTNQVFHFGGVSGAGMLGSRPDIELYFRNVTASNDTVIFNRERMADTGTNDFSVAPPADSMVLGLFAQAPANGGHGPRIFRGRGGADPSVAEEEA